MLVAFLRTDTLEGTVEWIDQRQAPASQLPMAMVSGLIGLIGMFAWFVIELPAQLLGSIRTPQLGRLPQPSQHPRTVLTLTVRKQDQSKTQARIDCELTGAVPRANHVVVLRGVYRRGVLHVRSGWDKTVNAPIALKPDPRRIMAYGFAAVVAVAFGPALVGLVIHGLVLVVQIGLVIGAVALLAWLIHSFVT